MKKLWIIIAIFVVIGIMGEENDENTVSTTNNEMTNVEKMDSAVEQAESTTGNDEVSEAIEVVEEDIPTEFKSALKTAKTYSDTMHMSKAGIYDQLVSEYGEQFTEEAAQYAIDNLEVDWKENALKMAETYQETMSMSLKAIYDQLISEYGEQFTEEEAQYAIDNLE